MSPTAPRPGQLSSMPNTGLHCAAGGFWGDFPLSPLEGLWQGFRRGLGRVVPSLPMGSMHEAAVAAPLCCGCVSLHFYEAVVPGSGRDLCCGELAAAKRKSQRSQRLWQMSPAAARWPRSRHTVGRKALSAGEGLSKADLRPTSTLTTELRGSDHCTSPAGSSGRGAALGYGSVGLQLCGALGALCPSTAPSLPACFP